MNNKKTLAPELRFKGFDGEWEKSELEKLTSKITVGIATEVRPFVSDKEDVPLLRNQNIKAGYFDDTSMEYMIPKFDAANKTKRVQSGDIIIVRTGSNTGNACVVPERFKGAQTFTTLIVRPISNLLNSEFLSYHINYFGLSEIQRLSAGGGKPNLNAGFLRGYRINVGEKVEQQKIASFLSAVDEKIQQLSRKNELLEQYKRGVMQQLFSGKLRFKDENGKEFPKWEEKRLGDIAVFKMGQSPDSKSYNTDSVGMLLIQGNADINGRVTNPRQWTSEPTKICEIGDLILTVRAPVGSISKSLHHACLGRGVCSIKNTKNSNIEFLYQFFLGYEDKWKKIEQGSTFTAVNGNEINSIKLNVPTILEQKKIANYLSNIDNKIEIVNKQITQTQTFKKGLLQQMLV